MLRIHFTASDLTRLRVGTTWGPLTEAMFSLVRLQEPRANVLVDGWRRGVAARLGSGGEPLLATVGPFAAVDLVTMTGATATLDEALDNLLAADDAKVRLELDPLLPRIEERPLWARSWLHDLRAGDRTARRHLANSLRAYGERAIAPHWDAMRSHLEVDRAVRGRIMAEGGVDRLLSTLHPAVRWHDSTLEIAQSPGPDGRPRPDIDDELDGRSLILVPSVFCPRPTLFWDPTVEDSPDLLFYPALHDPGDALELWAPGAAASGAGAGPGSARPALDALLGRTRAAALVAVADTCTTNELARRIGVSAPTASHHAGVLRDAGLISTQRYGSSVLHTLTVRGGMLLEGPGGRALGDVAEAAEVGAARLMA